MSPGNGGPRDIIEDARLMSNKLECVPSKLENWQHVHFKTLYKHYIL